MLAVAAMQKSIENNDLVEFKRRKADRISSVRFSVLLSEGSRVISECHRNLKMIKVLIASSAAEGFFIKISALN